jgi:hypothetical protein
MRKVGRKTKLSAREAVDNLSLSDHVSKAKLADLQNQKNFTIQLNSNFRAHAGLPMTGGSVI